MVFLQHLLLHLQQGVISEMCQLLQSHLATQGWRRTELPWTEKSLCIIGFIFVASSTLMYERCTTLLLKGALSAVTFSSHYNLPEAKMNGNEGLSPLFPLSRCVAASSVILLVIISAPLPWLKHHGMLVFLGFCSTPDYYFPSSSARKSH